MKPWAAALGLALAIGVAGAQEPTPPASEKAPEAAPDRSWWEDTPWGRHDRGFNWYPEAPRKRPPPKPAERTPRKFSDLKTLKEITEEFEWLKERAVLTPSPQNVREYLVFQDAMYSQSAMFADVYRRVNWQSPELDRNNIWPTANFARVEQNVQRWRDEEQLVKALAKTHGILFFYRSDCPYCHTQAPILKMLAEQYGLDVLAISLDGKPIDGFPNWRPDNGISYRITGGQGITVTPTLIMVSRDQKDVTLLGTGVMALSQIVERVRVLKTTAPGREYQ